MLLKRHEETSGILNWVWFAIHHENKRLPSEGTGHF